MEQPKPPSWQDHGGQPSPSKPPRIASSLSAKVARLTAELEAMRANRDEWAQIDKAEIAKLREDLQRLRDGAPDNALAAKDAEIARLRAELDAAHASINQHLGQTAAHRKEADALLKEIDAAHAALGIGPRDAVTIAEAVEALKRERDTARAALDKEREATLRDLHRELIECGREWQANGHRPTHDEYLRQVDLVARRAAEAKEPR